MRDPDSPRPTLTIPPNSLVRQSVPRQVADQLVELIAGSPNDDEVLLPPERELQHEFSVSRNSIREALAALQHNGIVMTRGNGRVGIPARARNYRISHPFPAGGASALTVEPVEVRQLLEPGTAALAAERATAEDIAVLESWVEQLRRSPETGDSPVTADAGFHTAVAAAARNSLLSDLVDGLTDELLDSRERSFQPVSVRRYAAEHAAVVDAIRRRDPEGARKAMEHHLQTVDHAVRLTLEASEGDGADPAE